MLKTHCLRASSIAVCAGSLLLLLSLLPIQAAGLLSNAGFESDTNNENQTLFGWQSYGQNFYNEANPSVAHSGTNYLKLYQAFVGTVNYTGLYQDYISGPGATYSADGWAFTASSDVLAGQNQAWLEVSFRDAAGNVLSLYRSAIITTNSIATGRFPKSVWNDLRVTNQYDPNSYALTNTVTTLVAPAGTFFVRYQLVLQGDANYSGGSVYFDDLNLVSTGGSPYGNYNITWSDEFNGTNINTNTWTFESGNGCPGNCGWGNNELEYYTARTNNAYVSGGLLHIVAQRESTNGFNYTSARMKSEGLFSCQYGRIEWRAQLPAGVGTWPALWVMGTNIANLGWPGCGEIDVMESDSTNTAMAQSSIHSGSDATAIYNFTDGNSTTNFHNYTLDWTTNAMLFYVDGHLFETQTSWGSSTTNTYPFPFNQPFFLLMNLAIGGNYVGNPTTGAINSGTVFPAQVLVDYVRVYNLTPPLQLALKKNGINEVIQWPGNIVCRLQSQTNVVSRGLGTNWQIQPTSTNMFQITPGQGDGYFRLISP
ncbi:MAG TPA: glycoside hydrolase family 16 protein [Candidatus Sulfotelmatobacter sp.]|nr:glycoside hydrolase family 16 protein [Candidatus Sulfotelmatobacter sp.]